MFEWITSPEAWIALATLTALEIVLGIDNIIFISILSGRLAQGAATTGPKPRPGRRDADARRPPRCLWRGSPS